MKVHMDLSNRNRSKGITATLLAALMITSVLTLLTPAVQAQPYHVISNPVFYEYIDVQGGAWDTVLGYDGIDLFSGNWRANLRIGDNQAWIDPNYFPASVSVVDPSFITSTLVNSAPNPYGMAAGAVTIDMDARMINGTTNLGLRGYHYVQSEPWLMEQTYTVTNTGEDKLAKVAFFMYYFPSPYGRYPTNIQPSHVDYTAGIDDPMGYIYDITLYGEGEPGEEYPNWAYTGLSAKVAPTAHDVGHGGGYPDLPYYNPYDPGRPSAISTDVLRRVEDDAMRGWASYDAPTGEDPNAVAGALKWYIGYLKPGYSWTITVLQSVAPHDAPIISFKYPLSTHKVRKLREYVTTIREEISPDKYDRIIGDLARTEEDIDKAIFYLDMVRHGFDDELDGMYALYYAVERLEYLKWDIERWVKWYEWYKMPRDHGNEIVRQLEVINTVMTLKARPEAESERMLAVAAIEDAERRGKYIADWLRNEISYIEKHLADAEYWLAEGWLYRAVHYHKIAFWRSQRTIKYAYDWSWYNGIEVWIDLLEGN